MSVHGHRQVGGTVAGVKKAVSDGRLIENVAISRRKMVYAVRNEKWGVAVGMQGSF